MPERNGWTIAERAAEDSTDRELVDQARAEGTELVGENGLPGRLTKLVVAYAPGFEA